MNNLKVLPLWINGIVDSEGNFSINYNAKSNKIAANFKVTQRGDSIAILHMVKSYFNVGSICIDNRKESAFKYSISNANDLINVIVPHFDKYPLSGSKQLDFINFKNALLLFNDKVLNKNEILKNKNNMNKSRSFDEKWLYLENKNIKLSNEWIQSFVDGEGCFQFTIVDSVSNGKPYFQINATLEIAQNTHDVKLLEAIKTHLNMGYIKPKFNIHSLEECKGKRSVSRLVINHNEKIIKFFEDYPLVSQKNLDFSSWKTLIEMKNNKIHLTESGLNKMKTIKHGMNRGRILNSNLLSTNDKIKLANSSLIFTRKYHHMFKHKKKLSFLEKLKIFLRDLLIVLILLISILGYSYTQCVNIEEDNYTHKVHSTSETALDSEVEVNGTSYEDYQLVDTNNDTLTAEDLYDQQTLETVQRNHEAFYYNSLIKQFPGSSVFILDANAINLLEKLRTDCHNLPDSSDNISDSDSITSSEAEYEKLVREIRSRSDSLEAVRNLIVFTPKEQSSFTADASVLSPVTPPAISFVRRRYVVITESGDNWEERRLDPTVLNQWKDYNTEYYTTMKLYDPSKDAKFLDKLEKSKPEKEANTDWMEKESYNIDKLFDENNDK